MYAHQDATNSVAKIAIAAVNDLRHSISWIAWSYSGTPVGGTLRVLDAGDVVFDIDVTLTGSDKFDFGDSAIIGSPGADMIVELTAGGVGLKGKVNVCYRDI